MKYLKLFEEFAGDSDRPYNSENAGEALRILKKTYSVEDLSRMGLGRDSSVPDVKYLYYKECKKDTSNIVKKLASWVTQECVSLSDIELFSYVAKEFPLEITSMTSINTLLPMIAHKRDTKMAKKFFEVISYEHDGELRIKEIVKKFQPSLAKFDSIHTWVLEFLFDEGIICVDGSKPIPYQIDFTQLPTELIEKLAQDTVVTEADIDIICDQASWTDIEERMILFTSLPPVWEYLTKHPDVIDKKMGLATFGDFMPKAKVAEINHVRRGRQSGKKFGF